MSREIRLIAERAARRDRGKSCRSSQYKRVRPREEQVRLAADAFTRAIRQASASIEKCGAGIAGGSNTSWLAGRLLHFAAIGDGLEVRRAHFYTMSDTGRLEFPALDRRTRVLARLTASERRAFIKAIRAAPGIAPELQARAREAFAHALRDARARDKAATKKAYDG